jgi:hypothetical protein
MPRPTEYRHFYDNISSAVISSDGQTALTLTVANTTYIPASGGMDDSLAFQVNVAATTREGITYNWNSPPYGYSWVTVSQTISGFSGDNSCVWIPLNFTVLFYGVNYTGLWIYSNGFISFTSGNCAATSPTSLPNGNLKDTIVAPFWKMLKLSQGGSIKTGHIVQSWPGDNGLRDYQVFTWDTIPDVNGYPQTFQLLIQDRSGSNLFAENLIYFQYLSVTTESVPTTIGGQDRLGYHGTVHSLSGISNHQALGLTAENGAGGYGYRLTSLEYRITKSDLHAMLLLNPLYEEGWNVELNSSGDKHTSWWQQVIEAGATTLADLTGVGEVINGMYLLYDLTAAYAETEYIPASGDLVSANQNQNQASGYVVCESLDSSCSDGAMYGCPFDAAFVNSVYWYMCDSESLNHTITVTATASYEDWNYDVSQVSTSVVLSMHVGQHYLDLQTASEHADGTGAQNITNVPVWVNGEEYYSAPITLFGTHNTNYTVSCQSSIWIGSQRYVFHIWSPSPPGASANPQTFNLTSDLHLTATYYPDWSLNVSVPGFGNRMGHDRSQWDSVHRG